MTIAAIIDGRSFEPCKWSAFDDAWRAELASRTKELLVGAYDQEGVFVWRPGRAILRPVQWPPQFPTDPSEFLAEDQPGSGEDERILVRRQI